MSRHPALDCATLEELMDYVGDEPCGAPAAGEAVPPVCDFCVAGTATLYLLKPDGIGLEVVVCPRCDGTGGSSPTAVAEARKAASLRERAP